MARNPYRVLICEDHHAVANAIAHIVGRIREDLQIELASSFEETLAKLEVAAPEVFILDVNQSYREAWNKAPTQGLSLVEHLRTLSPQTQVIGLSNFFEGDTVREQSEAFDVFIPNLMASDAKRFAELLNELLRSRSATDVPPRAELIVPARTSIAVVNRQLIEIFRKNPLLLRAMDPFQFEELVAELFEADGYSAALTPPRQDGGKDLYVYKSDAATSTMFVVECKRYVPPNKVDVGVVRQLHGVAQAEGATGGVVVTTSFFTEPAINFARSVPYKLFLRDFHNLTQWLRSSEKPKPIVTK